MLAETISKFNNSSPNYSTGSAESSNVVRLQTPSDFQKSWRDRCLNENAIAPSVYAANIQFLDDAGVYEALGWTIPNQAGFRSQHWNEAAAFVGEDGQPWQLRPDVPRVSKDGKVGKYESPKNGGAKIFFPNIPIDIRQKIAQRWGVDVPLMGSFWAWFNSSKDAKKIPVVPTEGGTKCLSLISQAIPSISLYGCSSAWEKRDSKYDRRSLLPQLRETVRGRSVYFAFDSDVKPQAQATVRSAIALIGKAIHRVLAPSVKVMTWNPEQGKGIDDFIAGQGSDALNEIIEQAIDFKEWRKTSSKQWANATYSLYAGRAKADLSACAPTVTDCGFRLPELGEALLVSAAMGTGKTHWFGVVIPQLREQYPDLIVDAIGHRNNLLAQTAKRLNLTHIKSTASGKYTAARIEHEETLAYCIDSLWRRFDTLIRAMDRGQKVLLILDELDAVMKHLLLSATIKPQRRIDLLRKFGILLKQIALGNGWVIGGEAGLTSLAVEALRDLSQGTLKITVAENTTKPAPWKCINVTGWKQGQSGPVAATPKQVALRLVADLLMDGQTVFLMTTSQDAAEQFDNIFSPEFEVRRFDSKTSAEPENRGVFERLGDEIRESRAKLFIGTPTIESGVSIEGAGLVDAIVLYGSGLEPSTSYQMPGRPRDPNIPRYLVVADQARQGVRGSFDPAIVLQKWRDQTSSVMGAHELQAELDPTIKAAHELAAKYLSREYAGASNLKEFLLEKLRADGHSIEDRDIELQGNEGDRLKASQDELEKVRIAEWKAADDSGLTPESARMKMRDSDLRWSDRVTCLKAIARGKYGDLVDKDSWIETYWANERDGKVLENAVRTAAEFNTEGMAAESDRRALQRQIKATGTIWGAEFKGRDRVIQVLQDLNLQCILPYVGSETPIHGDHWSVRSVFKAALLIPDEIQDVLGLTVTPDTVPMSFVSDLLKNRLGYEFEEDRVMVPKPSPELNGHQNHLEISIGSFGGQLNTNPDSDPPEPPKRKRGRPKKTEQTQRIRIYYIKPCPHHVEMVAAIVNQHQSSPEPEEPTAETKIQPGRSISWGGELWTVVAVRCSEVWLCEGGVVQPIDRCLKTELRFVLESIAV
jgi:Domain of unknown function (DUF3854)